MSYRKESYADLEKWRHTVTEYNRNYYQATSGYERRPWTEEEIRAIMKREVSDRDLSKILHRSMKSIVMKRNRIILT